MAKNRQLVVRLDDDLNAMIEETAAAYNRSRAEVVGAALALLAALDAKGRRDAIVRYVTRDIPAAPNPAEATARTAKPGPKGFRPPKT